jgi:RimJ/RimL family protein N-acetyltransferase
MKTSDIVTERLIIRSMTADDAEIAWSFWGNPEVGKYLADPFYKNADELRGLISDIDEWTDDYPFIAYHKDTRKAVATCSVGPEGSSLQWGFGYCIRKDL